VLAARFAGDRRTRQSAFGSYVFSTSVSRLPVTPGAVTCSTLHLYFGERLPLVERRSPDDLKCRRELCSRKRTKTHAERILCV
jgi:hypothetical protein